MVFAYYNRLTRAQQRIYRLSDEISSIEMLAIATLGPLVEKMARVLQDEDRRKTEAACQEIVSALADSLKIYPVRVEVMAMRPSRSWGELHGLYTPKHAGRRARITVWMRTAKRRQVVALRTFLRTLIHEFCHHLDYELLALTESFHTNGFYRRESSLVHQMMRSHRG